MLEHKGVELPTTSGPPCATMRAAKLQGLGTGADSYLTKPFHRDELLTQLRNL